MTAPVDPACSNLFSEETRRIAREIVGLPAATALHDTQAGEVERAEREMIEKCAKALWNKCAFLPDEWFELQEEYRKCYRDQVCVVLRAAGVIK